MNLSQLIGQVTVITIALLPFVIVIGGFTALCMLVHNFTSWPYFVRFKNILCYHNIFVYFYKFLFHFCKGRGPSSYCGGIVNYKIGDDNIWSAKSSPN